MKICLIGYGYWGKIIFNNLRSLGFSEITVVDETLNNLFLISDEFDCYFIVTPFSTHKYFLDKLSKYKNKKIWCEKPLVEFFEEAIQIYSSLKENNNKLFVDWVYTFNSCIIHLKNVLKNKKLKQIILNRTNSGPVRTDCTSVHDLSSHDLSILYFLFEDLEFDFKFNEFSIDGDKNFGSNISWCYINGIQIIINSSWEHENKNRVSLFITDNNEIIVFDDVNKIIINNGLIEDFSSHPSPIENSINYFIKEDDFSDNKSLTIKITKDLESIYEHKI
jgi:predicted dehydrogenase